MLQVVQQDIQGIVTPSAIKNAFLTLLVRHRLCLYFFVHFTSSNPGKFLAKTNHERLVVIVRKSPVTQHFPGDFH